jgi:hypothetical protein
MLTKNVYILYPAGYSGSYVNWAIHASDDDLCKQTVESPINLNSNSKYGGIGTSHLHHRIPTHQSIKQHLPWLILNKPVDKKVYILNSDKDDIAEVFCSILGYDKDPIFIVVHDNNDMDIRSYGQINCSTKWPVFFAANHAMFDRKLTFDPFDCANDRNFRNLVAENQVGFRDLYPLDDCVLDQVKSHYLNYLNWFRARNLQNPHEVNADYYIDRESFPENCIFQISCLDVVTENFPNILNNILNQSQCLSSFDTNRIASVHQEYVKIQKNLQWFDSLNTWKQQGHVDEYLLSHSAIQGMIISRILKDCELEDRDPVTGSNPLGYMAWQAFYYRVKDPSWPECDHEQDFYLLPKKVQIELIQNFNYVPKFSADPERAKCRSALVNWKNLSLEEINTIYQSFKKNFNTLSSVS